MEYKILVYYTLWSKHSLRHTVSAQGKIQWANKRSIEKNSCPQRGFRQDLGIMTGLWLACCTELEFAFNMKKNLPLKTVQMWDRGGNGHLTPKLKRGFHYLIFALLAKRSSTYTEIWFWQRRLYALSFHAEWFLFQGGKGNLLPDFFKEKKLQLYKNVTRNLFYRLERRLGFLKTVAWNYYTLGFASDPSFWEL